MSVRGDAPEFLGSLNRHGVPANALRFDVGANLVLIVLLTVVAGGNVGEVPIALLAAANVGYFVSMTLALLAAWLNHRHPVRPGLIRLRPGLARLSPILAGFNVILLLAAGAAWGWWNMLIGVVVLGATVTLATLTRGRHPVATDASLPPCFGRSAHASAHPLSVRAERKEARV
jgi:L-asparagine transporter-like permease